MRKEFDTFGEIEVPEEKLWGAQTQRSLQNFEIGSVDDKMPLSVIKAMAIVKKSAARVNMNYGLKPEIGNAIVNAANEVIDGKYDGHFPLVIFQTGSGTQTNMNVNEVLANRSSELMGGPRGKDCLVNPNDHVNKSQSSNDTYPTAMHVSVAVDLNRMLFPAVKELHSAIAKKVEAFKDIIKIGRTHTQDATPLTLGQEFSAYLQQVDNHIHHLEYASKYVYKLAQGGTAVGTGLNTTEGFDKDMAKAIAEETGLPFETAENKFEALATKDALANFHGVLNSFATSLYKIASDVLLLSGELKELVISHPDACEETKLNCVQVMGNQTAVTVGNMHGHFELNVFKPLIVSNVLKSMELLTNSCSVLTGLFDEVAPNKEEISKLMTRSLMLVTALNPYIGYHNAAKIAKYAHKNHLTLKEAAVKLEILNEQQVEEYIKPENMVAPSKPKK
eukprot:CAMPEP_0170518532 /NCGR_PEP_ID=MMETSP0209-20121228/4198_1 /TAXON_ID=665100 ORGANISM="Litonotus pictus, Strain P1" /NCGR_SAMPLE_ID=MMETSP0209 /ASSEMBLY_ACC=CAM_ASM_000301 /LENGTH=447 /DNA_ID=CAMNT_0010804129 /DNA_START=92 /DNA_END=1435 /DNA_ORIENTATION=+